MCKENEENDVLKYTKDVFMTNPVASSQDCTGITQTIPATQEEADAIAGLMNIPATAHISKSKFPKGHNKFE